MKQAFFDYLFALMGENPDIYLLMAGLGYPRYDDFKKAYPDRVINTEASEQTALDIAVGLAYAGKTPVVYTITPFLLRGFETIRTYINHEQLPVTLIGAGRDDDYSKDDGYSHDAEDIGRILMTQEHVWQYYPTSNDALRQVLSEVIAGAEQPRFISLTR